MLKILHLSNTSLSGSPYRISQLLGKYTQYESRHICWKRKILTRVFPMDIVGEETSINELEYWLNWCTHVHYHNIYSKQEIFKYLPIPNKPSVIQIHSPKDWFDYKAVIESKLPIAVIAQFHTRQWEKELSFIVPNVVDINSSTYTPQNKSNLIPVVSYAPSNGTGKGWNQKSYEVVTPFLKKLERTGTIQFQKIFNKSFEDCMLLKQQSDIGIDEISTGSYHLSTLEYLAMGITTICYTDELTEKTVKDLTGCTTLPWIHNGPKNIGSPLNKSLHSYKELGILARHWMETFWTPQILCDHYTKMYNSL